jgi:hypothetical protein
MLRKKQGKKKGAKKEPVNKNYAIGSKEAIYKGRSIMFPGLLILMLILYVTSSQTAQTTGEPLFWVTFVLWILLIVIYILRRPFVAIGKDYVKTRRMMGDKTMYTVNIRGIVIQQGSIVIEFNKGANWVFTRSLNRYPIALMVPRFEKFAHANHIPLKSEFDVRTKQEKVDKADKPSFFKKKKATVQRSNDTDSVNIAEGNTVDVPKNKETQLDGSAENHHGADSSSSESSSAGE